jgi:RNA polymerase sigma-70 factor (ECF subfamily)
MAGESDPRSDEDLMLAYAAGNAPAFELLYARHQEELFRFISRLLGASLAGLAESVFQDTWVRMIAARKDFLAQGARWRTWAFTIACKAALERMRVSSRDFALEPAFDESSGLDWLVTEGADLAEVEPDDEGGAVHREAYWRTAGQKLLQCLELLPSDQRIAFLLHHADGASLEDMAARLGLPPETAQQRVRQALHKLRSCMGAYLQAPEPTR